MFLSGRASPISVAASAMELHTFVLCNGAVPPAARHLPLTHPCARGTPSPTEMSQAKAKLPPSASCGQLTEGHI